MNNMNFKKLNSLHKEILSIHPNAVKVIDHVIDNGELPIGTVIMNHPEVASTEVTKEMLENNFPSLQESFWWYII
jgi:hypothetical protein